MLGIWNEVGKKAPWVLLLSLVATFVLVATADAVPPMRLAKARANYVAHQKCLSSQKRTDYGVLTRECVTRRGDHVDTCFRESLQRPDLVWCDVHLVLFDYPRGEYLYCFTTIDLVADGRARARGYRVLRVHRWMCYWRTIPA